MSVRFIFRPSEAAGTNQPGSIICRITVDKARRKFTTDVSCLKKNWDANAQAVKGTSRAARTNNIKLTAIRDDINEHYLNLERAKEHITADRLLRLYMEKGKVQISMIAAWALWQASRKPLVGITISATSLGKGELRGKRLAAFLESAGQKDITPDEFDEGWCDRFMDWMRVHRAASQNYTNKVVQSVKQFLKWCVKHKHAKKNPLADYSLKFAPPATPLFISKPELDLLATYPFVSEALRKVADVFLFQCYTGLAYADLKRFNAKQDTQIRGGRCCIIMTRQKTAHSTGQEAIIPVLNRTEALLARYGETLPVPTNQVYNRMLKEVASIVGMSQKITSHVGRKTAGRLWLDEGVSMPAVSKALGHKNVAMTERIYVKVGEELVQREFERVYGKQKPDKAA